VSSATSPAAVCTCTDTTVCDDCASQQIEATTPTDGYVELLPGVLTPDEQSDLRSAVTGWLGVLNGGQHG
jgi:hypothetical protein